MKTRLIIFTALAVLSVGSACGQAKLNEMLHKIETHYVVNPPKPDAIEVTSETKKDKAGNIIESRKLFVIHNWPALVNELEKAFAADKAHADFVKESNNTKRNKKVTYERFKRIETEVIVRNVSRSYFFKIGERGGVFFQMFGTTDGKMAFTYAYATDARFIMKNIGLSHMDKDEKGDTLKFEEGRVIKLYNNGGIKILPREVSNTAMDKSGSSLQSI